jgi:superfamily II DNA helicase RecQ
MDLVTIIKRNPGILLSKSHTRGLLNDIFQNDAAKVNVLLTAYDIGIVSEMRKSFPMDALAKGRFVKILVQQHSIIDDRAIWAVDTWVSCFSSDILAELARVEQERQDEVEKTVVPTEAPKKKEKAVSQGVLQVREDYDNYYINPTIDEMPDKIYVPCGIGNTDKGFFIYGIKKEMLCTHKDANVYALIYNYLVRGSKITDDDIPHYINSIESPYELDYRSIYRLAIVLLQMVKNNYMADNGMELSYKGDKDNLRYAVGMINNYAALFCRLMNIERVKMEIILSGRGHKLNLDGSSGIFVRNNTELISNAREIWYGRKINYRLGKGNLRDIEYILSEISPFDSFKEGQYEVLCRMLGSKKHMVCIMPTGSGKSLIFYMASILQPLPMFIVAPTEILIEDQIRNLKKFHHMDNVAHLRLTDENSFSEYDIHNSLNYLTPMTLQNRHLLVKFRYINSGTKLIKMHEEKIASGPLVSYIVLDEIHCLSNWGHDFRPEYLMLSKYLNKYLDQINLLGFTATANYTVVEDVQQQLGIPQENFLSPVSFEKYNVSYDFRCVRTPDEMYAVTGEIAQRLIDRNERTIIFTKNDNISRMVADVVGYEADVFSTENPEAYHHFVDGRCKVLIASEELGIGVNFPNINNIIHFGLPLSKNEYVQEVGRAGRANERVRSYVIYLENGRANIPESLLKRNTDIDEIPGLLSGIDNDYADIYRKLTNNCPTKDELYNSLIRLYNEFVSDKRVQRVISYGFDVFEDVKQRLFMLYTVGYINDWYSYCMSKDGDGIDILIDICSTDSQSYITNPQKMLLRMKKRLRDYFDFLGNNREGIAKTDRANTPEEVIRVFVDWYYIKYLYHHNEQFLDLYEFIISNSDNDSDRITSGIKDYFSLPFIKLKSDEALYSDMSVRELTNKAIQGMSKAAMANIERINSNRYSYKLDFLLFCGHLRMYGQFEESRLDRLMRSAPNSELHELTGSFGKLYSVCDIAGKLSILNYLESNASNLGIVYNDFLKAAYKNGTRDLIYYGIMAKRANQYFTTIRRNQYV